MPNPLVDFAQLVPYGTLPYVLFRSCRVLPSPLESAVFVYQTVVGLN